jgi:hypothetical protein
MKAFERALGAVLALSLAALVGFLIYKAATSADVMTAFRSAGQSNGGSADGGALASFWRRTADDPLALYALLLALFTLALVVVSAIQIAFLIRASRTSRIGAEAARKSAEATAALVDVASRQEATVAQQIAIARDAAEAARTSADAASQGAALSRIALRPYLFVSGLELADVESAVPDPHFRLRLTNYGQTPAIMHAVQWQFEILDPSAGRRFGGGPGRIILSTTLSAREEAGDILIRPARTDLSALMVRKVRSNEVVLRLWLRVTYADVFGEWHEEFPDYRYHDEVPGTQFVRTIDIAGAEAAADHPLMDDRT